MGAAAGDDRRARDHHPRGSCRDRHPAARTGRYAVAGDGDPQGGPGSGGPRDGRRGLGRPAAELCRQRHADGGPGRVRSHAEQLGAGDGRQPAGSRPGLDPGAGQWQAHGRSRRPGRFCGCLGRPDRGRGPGRRAARRRLGLVWRRRRGRRGQHHPPPGLRRTGKPPKDRRVRRRRGIRHRGAHLGAHMVERTGSRVLRVRAPERPEHPGPPLYGDRRSEAVRRDRPSDLLQRTGQPRALRQRQRRLCRDPRHPAGKQRCRHRAFELRGGSTELRQHPRRGSADTGVRSPRRLYLRPPVARRGLRVHRRPAVQPA